MNTESGINTSDVQYAICTGQAYGNKEWSDSQRQDACQRYKELTGKEVKRDTSNNSGSMDFLVVAIILLALMVTIFGYYIYRRNLKVSKSHKK